MKFLKTGFSRVHAAVAAVALAALLIGGGMALGLIPYRPYGLIHGILGLSVFPLWAVLPLLSKKRRNLYRALRAKAILSRADFRRGDALAIAAKSVTMLMGLMFLMQAVTGLMMMTGLTYRWFPSFGMLSFHTSFMYLMGALVSAHAALMLARRFRKPARKP